MNTVFYSIFVVLFLLIVALIYLNITTENFSDANDQPKLEYYSLSTCPHCVRFDKTWEKISQQCKGNAHKYVVDKDDTAQVNANKYQINGFPTIIVTQNGEKKDELHDSRTCESIKALCEKNGVPCSITC